MIDIKAAKKRQRDRILGSALGIFRTTLFFLAILIVAEHYLLTVKKVEGRSMEQTLPESSYILCVRTRHVQHGDIIVFGRNGKSYVKRVIGLPGDEIEIANGSVFRNGERVNEDYACGYTSEKEMTGVCRLSDGEYFVLGDNRDVSSDSRGTEIGTVRNDEIEGKVLLHGPKL